MTRKNTRKKLILAFSLVIAMMLIIISITAVNLRIIEHNTLKIREDTIPHAILADTIALNLVISQQWLTDVSVTKDTEGFDNADESEQVVVKGLEQFEEFYLSIDEPVLYDRIKDFQSRFENFYILGKRMTVAYLEGDRYAGDWIMKEFDRRADALQKEFLQIRELHISQMKGDSMKVLDSVKNAEFFLMVFLFTGLSASVIIVLVVVSD